MKNKSFWAVLVVVLVAAAFYMWNGKSGDTPGAPATAGSGAPGGGRGGMGGPMPVQADTVKSGDIEVTIDALGTVTALNTSIVKPRVNGQLVRVNFREGQVVKQGEVLAEIDPRPFQATLDQAAGQLARDEALLANARADMDRYQGLLQKDSIARQQVDDQVWLVRQYEGAVKNDQGAVSAARLNVEFTRVTAPFSGRVGLRQVDVGNYVQTGDANGIAVVTQTQPIYVVFAIPADQLGTVTSRMRAGEKLSVEAWARGGKTLIAKGVLMSVDNQIDTTTGTVKLKAEFPNKDEQLFPNQFVNARLNVETQHDVTLMPTAAIQRGTKGTFAYVIKKNEQNEETVSVQTVELGPISGDVVAVEKGLQVGDRVVIDGADKLREGAQVVISTPGAGLKDEEKAPPNNQEKPNDSGGKSKPGNGNNASAS
ncbi:MAG: MdtA/MuxA family multidrug efflux RND transporter periplasmic adaptor subunit [Methylobacillus sp.]|jgi:multidrug efflux system membrane fusion protein|nr:MdtA/MuxA family multidrug efflux RND transporter periplasmic adaptor subunit [Methylobacillus sp.]